MKHWKCTKDTLNWLSNITEKEQHSFIAFDIVNFYPWISFKLLGDALKFAEDKIDISGEEKEIIHHAKQSLLYYNKTAWKKKNFPNAFDVTMGSFNGAETCELMASYLLHQRPEGIRSQVGLYRDDGLGAFKMSPQRLERVKKQICKVFKDNGLRITIDANKKIVNFLDVTLDLNKGTHQSYLKPGNKPLYVYSESNHPPSITKNIPVAVNKRLNELSSNKDAFDENELVLNLKKGKTEAMLFGTAKRVKLHGRELTISYNGTSISFVSEYVYLGNVIDSTLTLQSNFNRA